MFAGFSPEKGQVFCGLNIDKKIREIVDAND